MLLTHCVCNVGRYRAAARDSITRRVVFQTKIKSQEAVKNDAVLKHPSQKLRRQLTLEREAPTGARNLRRKRREAKWAKKRAQIEAQKARQQRQLEEALALRHPEDHSSDEEDASHRKEDEKKQKKRKRKSPPPGKGPLDLKELDVGQNSIGDLGLAALIDVVRPNKHEHNHPGGFIVSLSATGNAKPLGFYKGKCYQDLYVSLLFHDGGRQLLKRSRGNAFGCPLNWHLPPSLPPSNLLLHLSSTHTARARCSTSCATRSHCVWDSV